MLVKSEVDNDAEPEKFFDCLDSLDDTVGGQQDEGHRPIISLHALFSTEGFQTMRIQGHVKNQNMVILVDTGSTYNLWTKLSLKGWKANHNLLLILWSQLPMVKN